MGRKSTVSPIGGAPVYFVDRIGSTMDLARDLVADGAPSGTIAVADFQSAGRGRRAGRTWYSRPGDSLMFTLALSSVPDLAGVSLRVGLAVVRSLSRLCELHTTIKWPNDVMAGGMKIAGVLCDLIDPWLYVGIGVNLDQDAFPDELSTSATSVRLQHGTVPNRDDLLIDLVGELDRLLVQRSVTDAAGIRTEIEGKLQWKDTQVVVTAPDGKATTGILRGIAEDGCLLLESAGKVAKVVAGELSRTV